MYVYIYICTYIHTTYIYRHYSHLPVTRAQPYCQSPQSLGQSHWNSNACNTACFHSLGGALCRHKERQQVIHFKGVLQYVAVCWSVCSELQCVEICCSVRQCVKCVAVCCSGNRRWNFSKSSLVWNWVHCKFDSELEYFIYPIYSKPQMLRTRQVYWYLYIYVHMRISLFLFLSLSLSFSLTKVSSILNSANHNFSSEFVN